MNNIFSLDENNYMFIDGKETNHKLKYRHKVLIEDEKIGFKEKWSQWTNLDARLYCIRHNVRITYTRKKKA